MSPVAQGCFSFIWRAALAVIAVILAIAALGQCDSGPGQRASPSEIDKYLEESERSNNNRW